MAKLKLSQREEPKSLNIWIKHGLSELIGTFILSLLLAGLSIVAIGSDKIIEVFMLHKIIVGFYAGFIAVGLVIFIFIRWSCDLNPAVTITEWLRVLIV